MRLEDLTVDIVSLVDRAAVRDPANKNEPQRFLVWKRDGSDERSTMSDEDLRAALEKTEREKKEAQESHEQAIEALKTEHEQALKAVGEGGDQNDEDNDDLEEKPLNKADLSPAVRRALEKAEQAERDAQAEARRASEKAEHAEEIAKAERDQRVEGEFLAKAEGLGALSVTPTELGPVLKRASETLAKADYEYLDGLLTATSEQIKRSELYKEYGSSGPAPASGAKAEVERKAEELRKADPKLTPSAAFVEAMNSDPDLQRRYLAETR